MTAPAPCFLGIDAGGSKTAWLVLQGGTVLAEGVGDGIQVGADGIDRSATRLAETIAHAQAHAPGTVVGVVAGLAGAGSAEVRNDLRRALRNLMDRIPVRLAGDVPLAAAAALSEVPGVAVWSGTGSFAVARSVTGDLHRVGGRGWLLGDAGSAFAVARDAAAAVVAAADGLAPATELTRSLPAAAGVADPLDLGRRLQAWSPSAIAALYVHVRAAAERGDGVAIAIQRCGAEALARQALVAARHAALELASLRVALGGGVLVHDRGMQRLVRDQLVQAGVPPPQACVRSPARGAAELAQACARRLAPLCTWVQDDPEEVR